MPDPITRLNAALEGRYRIESGPLAGVLNTAQSSLIREPLVRDALNQWLGVATEVDETNQQAARMGEAKTRVWL